MANYIAFSHFNTGKRQYHIYMLTNSLVAQFEHYHNYFQLLYVASGQIEHFHSGDQILLGRGDVFIIPPGFSHRLSFAKASEVYSLSFTPQLFHSGFSHSNIYSFLTQLSEHGNDGEGILLKVSLEDFQRENMQALLNSLLREQKYAVEEKFTSAASLISASLYTVAQSYYDQKEAKQPLRGRYKTGISNCIRYVDEHYREEISVENISQKFGLSKSTLYELFAQSTGLPLKQYIRNKRILTAETLIRSNPNLTFAEIAGQVGYDESSTFYRNFVQVVGVSPSKYKSAYFSENQNKFKEDK